MTTPQIRSFSDFGEADAARAALIAAGVAPQAMELRVMETESGPAQGNWLVGNGRNAGADAVPGGTAQQAPYEGNHDAAVHRGEYLLIIQTPLPVQQIDTVLQRFDCVTP